MVFTPYVTPIGPITSITPFTYRDNATYLKILRELINYINNVLQTEMNAELQRILDEFNAKVDEFEADLAATKADWESQWTAFMANIEAELEALNDAAVRDLVNNATSLTGAAIRTLIDNESVSVDELDLLTKTLLESDTSETGEYVRTLIDTISQSWADDRIAKLKSSGYLEDVASESTATIDYKTWVDGAKTHNYTVVTIKANGSYRPYLIRPYLDIVNTTNPGLPSAESSARRYDIETARDKSGATVINNAGAHNTIAGEEGDGSLVNLRGYFRVDGVTVEGWPADTYWTGREGFGVLPTGELKGYSDVRGDAVPDVENGGPLNVWSFGPILVENGVERSLVDPFWDEANSITSSMNVIAQKANGDIMFINAMGVSGTSGMNLTECRNIALREGAKFAISMDRGGSAQCFAGKVPLVASQDTDNKRLISSYITTRVPVASPARCRPIPLKLSSVVEGYNGSTPFYTVDAAGTVRLYGNVCKIGQLPFPAAETTPIVQIPAWLMPPSNPANEAGLTGTSAADTVCKWILNTNDRFMRTLPRIADSNYISLSGMIWNRHV